MRKLSVALAALALVTTVTTSSIAQVRATIPTTTSSTPTESGSQQSRFVLQGTVTESGTFGVRPLAGAVVRVMPINRTVTSDASGRFSFADLAEGSYVVSASASGHRSVSQRVTVASDVTLTLNLKAIQEAQRSTLNGVIRDGAGNAIAGATIRLAPGRHQATSAADGSFSLANVADGRYTIIVRAHGMRTLTQRIVVGSDQPITLVMRASPDDRVDDDEDSDDDGDSDNDDRRKNKNKKAKKDKKEKKAKKHKHD